MLSRRQRALLRIRFLIQQQRSLRELERLDDPHGAYRQLVGELRRGLSAGPAGGASAVR
jgi:hypothetical protein